MKLSELQPSNIKPRLKLSNVLNNKSDSVASEGWEFLENHPFKALLQPIRESITGKTPMQAAEESTPIKEPSIRKEGRTVIGPTEKDMHGQLAKRNSAIEQATAEEMFTAPANVIGGKLIKPVVEEVVGAGRNIGKFVANTLNRGKADYLTSEVAPKVHQLFQDAVSKFTPEIEKFARGKNVPESAIRAIKKNGTQAIEGMKNPQGEYSTDAITQRVNQGLAAKDKEVSDAYQAATGAAKQNKAVIPLSRTKRTIAAILRNHGYIDKAGKETSMAENDLVQNSPLKTLLGYYKGLNPKTKSGVTGVNTYQWNDLRNNLSKLRRQDKSIEMKVVLDALHSDAERAGLKGIKEARSLAARNFEAEDKFTKGTGGVKVLLEEKGLGKYHTMSGEQKRGIQELANHLGDKNLVSDIEKTSAGQYLDKIKEGKDVEGFQHTLEKSKNKAWTIPKKKELEEILGKQNADKIIQEVIAHRKAGYLKTGAKVVGGLAATGAAGAIGRKVFDFATGH